MLRVVVKRKRWLRGMIDDKTSMLRNKQGEQCCLGFVARTAGVPAKELEDHALPSYLDRQYLETGVMRKLVKHITGNYNGNSHICNRLTETNDSDKYKPRKREALLKSLGKRIGVQFIFKD